MQGFCPTRIRKKERDHHEQQSNKPRTYQKGVPTCRGIKQMPPQGRDTLQPPLPAARHPRHKAVALHEYFTNGKRQTLLCGKKTICEMPRSTNA